VTSRSGGRRVVPPGGSDAIPAPAYFIAGAISQYLGAAVAVKLFDRLAPPGVAWLRVVVLALVLCLWRPPRWRGWPVEQRQAVAMFGVALAAMNLCFYLSIDRLPLGTAVAIEFLGPIAVALISVRTLRNVVALATAIAGVVLLADIELEGEPLGVLFALMSATFWAGYIVLGKRVASFGSGVEGLAAAGVVGVLAIAPFGIVPAARALDEPWVLLLAAGVGILSSAIPYALDQVVLRRISRGQFALLLAILPATAAVTGALVLRQRPTTIEVMAIALVVVAVLLREGDPAPLPSPGDA
jgi:inner membrane transporter RhtA